MGDSSRRLEPEPGGPGGTTGSACPVGFYKRDCAGRNCVDTAGSTSVAGLLVSSPNGCSLPVLWNHSSLSRRRQRRLARSRSHQSPRSDSLCGFFGDLSVSLRSPAGPPSVGDPSSSELSHVSHGARRPLDRCDSCELGVSAGDRTKITRRNNNPLEPTGGPAVEMAFIPVGL